MRQLSLFAPPAPADAPAPLTDEPLTPAELNALSRLGWEYPRPGRPLADGTPTLTLRFDGWGGEWERGDELRRTPGGWRMLIAEMGT